MVDIAGVSFIIRKRANRKKYKFSTYIITTRALTKLYGYLTVIIYTFIPDLPCYLYREVRRRVRKSEILR